MPPANAQEKNKKSRFGILFLGIVILVCIALALLNPAQTAEALRISGHMLLTLIPVFLLVIFFMGALNYFLHPQKVKNLFGKESGWKGWLLAVAFGIISHGSIYIWYPFLRQLREQGMRDGLLAAFIYNRAIKIPLLPVMVYYFGIKFTAVLFVYTVLASIIEGLMIETV